MRRSGMSSSVVELQSVEKVYDLGKVKVHALRGVDLRVERGEFVAVMGPSGSGKTTLLNIIGLLDKPTAGRVVFEGNDVTQLSERELAKLRGMKIGFVFQAYNLISVLTAVENVELPLVLAGFDPAEARRRAIDMLELVGLGDRLVHRPSELSGGEQQRVAIARALVTNPSLILADEPTGNIDRETGHAIMDLLRWLNETMGVTVVLVTHDPVLAGYASRVVYLLDGRVLPETPAEVVREASAERKRAFLAAQLRVLKAEAERLAALKGKLSEVEYAERARQIGEWLARLERAVRELA